VRPLLLDLFCGAGGASVGYHRAGFDVVGIDNRPQPHYPYPFHRGDALDPSAWLEATMGRMPDAIHASPPCQRYSDLAKRNGNAADWPDLVGPVRSLLQAAGVPWVIENVSGSPLVDPVVLCGTMFPGLRVLRHRLFESSVQMPETTAHRTHPLVFTMDKRKAHYGKLDEWTAFVSVNGGGNCSVASARDAMGIGWMTKDEINESIPPSYTEWVGAALLKALAGR
jgi:DNA (cytosine-5)-methyltransferase 1